MGSQALLLVGHGSQLSAESAAPVYAAGRRIRDLALFDEVREVFWKEEPRICDALNMLLSEQVFVVPVFLAEGYFTGRIIPRELGLSDGRCGPGFPRLTYCPPLGTHPRMAEMVLDRATAACDLSDAERHDTALVIVGHGTPRCSTSGDTVHRVAHRLRALELFGSVHCGFLDEEPRIEKVLEAVPEPNIVLVPFFIAEGWHTRVTIPRDLRLQASLTRRGGKSIWYASPVGTLPQIADVILEIAGSAGARRPGAAPQCAAAEQPQADALVEREAG